jgi:outer membrane protein with beta-barrel domain
MKLPLRLFGISGALAFGIDPAVVQAENYLGILKLPRSSLETPTGAYTFASSPIAALQTTPGFENGYQFKLGYKYSRFFTVEGQVNDFVRQGDPFASPSNLASGFRSSGFGVDTIATLPLWRFSFYGRLGAYRGDGRNPFSTYSTSLLTDPAARGTRWHYGFGMRYDFTKSLGITAELERYSPLGSSFSAETDSDLLSVGVKWRF